MQLLVLFIKFGNQLPNGLLDEIDNAPTVELFCSYLSDGEVRQPCVEGPCEHDRPKGEWILNKDENPECPFCHHSFTYWGNFCSNCGADMRKGGKE